ncbi:VanZ family protein [Streptomyces sp. DSM 44917]|uniref:VanZ family protein n=1 Tax=Streptomyces boetiae TaxID=3075541 RepID=A0ABU2L983_9ACTN|nr:VanZ family protein [Streptomyces sp. DSM 44917]MDT0308133.1 VanZ family protein [Streptomyces sp. DSM 44917]
MQQHPSGRTRPGMGPRVRAAALVLLLAHLACVAWLAFRPRDVLWISPANLEPLATVRADLARGPGEALRTIGAGLVRLAPLGVLLPLLGRRVGGRRFLSLSRTAFVAAVIALAIEAAQSVSPTHVADVDSVLLNTLGAALAHQLAYGPLTALAGRGPRAGRAVARWHAAARRPRPSKAGPGPVERPRTRDAHRTATPPAAPPLREARHALPAAG